MWLSKCQIKCIPDSPRIVIIEMRNCIKRLPEYIVSNDSPRTVIIEIICVVIQSFPLLQEWQKQKKQVIGRVGISFRLIIIFPATAIFHCSLPFCSDYIFIATVILRWLDWLTRHRNSNHPRCNNNISLFVAVSFWLCSHHFYHAVVYYSFWDV